MKKNIIFLLCIFLFLFGCETVPITGRKQLSIVPYSQLVSLANSNYQQVLKSSKISEDKEQTAMVVKVGTKVALAAEEFMRENGLEAKIKGYHWEFTLIEDHKNANAFCMPGGKIVVYTGILPITEDEAGLATVLAHEVAHAIANHGGERMSHILLVQLGGLTLSTAMRKKSEETQKWSFIAYGIGSSMGVILPFSRTHEWEADHIGLILMARAGYDPRRAVEFWERMAKISKSRLPQFLSTHPAPQSRIEAIKKELPNALKYYKK